MKRKKVYKLNTIEDISKVITKENFERMMMDIASSFQFYLQIKDKEPEIALKYLTWKDDNLTGLSAVSFLDMNGKEFKKIKFDLKKNEK